MLIASNFKLNNFYQLHRLLPMYKNPYLNARLRNGDIIQNSNI